MDGLPESLTFSFTVYKDADLYDFINAPIGKGKHIPLILFSRTCISFSDLLTSLHHYPGLPITQTLRPLVAIPVRVSFSLF